jgi:hypothetical protein
MKKLLLIFVVMIAFATTSSYAWTETRLSSSRVYASDGQQEYLAVNLPSGYGYTRLTIVLNNSIEGGYAYASSVGGSCSLYNYGGETYHFLYYAGTELYMSANSLQGGYSQVCAYYFVN